MIALIFLLVIAPCITGNLISSLTSSSLRDSLIFKYLMGFISDLAIWTVMTLVYLFIFPHGAFHILRYAYIGVSILLCLLRFLIAMVRHEDPRERLIASYTKLKTYISEKRGLPYLMILLIIAIVQIFSIMYYAPSEYVQDDYYYNSAVSDAVYMDQLYAKKSKSGAFPEDPENTPPYINSDYKMFLCPWIAFLALTAASSHIHPLIICHTLIPGFVIVLIYLTQYVIARYFFGNDDTKISIFLMWSAILTQTLCYSYYLFHLGIHVATWGKVSAALIGLPMLVLTTYDTIYTSTVMKNDASKLLQNCLFLFLMGAGTAMMAASIMMVGSAALFFLMISCFIKFRKKEVLIYSFAAELMILIQLTLWVLVIRT